MTRKIIALTISVMVLFLSIGVFAAVLPPEDSAVWKNLTDKQADELLNSQKESFIFFFYRDACPNSQRTIPSAIKYAKENGLVLCGLNVTEYSSWWTWRDYIPKGQASIGFPMIIAYNADDGLLTSKDNVLTLDEFKGILGEINMLPGSTNNSSKTNFKDVLKSNEYYDAIKELATEGVLSGYEDGSFRPDNSVSRAEAAAIIVRAAGLTIQSSKKSIYKDVSNAFWGKDYIMAASDAGIMSGIGGGIFEPQKNLTKMQIIKMLVCMAGLGDAAIENGGWPSGYAKVAYSSNIIDSSTYKKLDSSSFQNEVATRGQVAQWTYNAKRANQGESFIVGGKVYEIGMSALALDSPDEICHSTNGFDWYVYGTDTYEDFFAAGVADGEIVALASSGPSFEYQGYRAGDKLSSSQENANEFLTDKNDNNIIHGVFILSSTHRALKETGNKALKDESKMNFHFTNGFRLYHKKALYQWSDIAAESARNHSIDMAENDYFQHQSLDGRSPGDRMKNQGIAWGAYAENIFAGLPLGVQSYNSWINSSGHRENILGNCTYLGVGIAYDANSTYKFYSTQNFYSEKNYSSGFNSFFQ